MSTDVHFNIDEWVVDEDVKESLTCSICLDVLFQPVNLSTCSHTFCHHCVCSLVRQPQPKCPQCVAPLSATIRAVLNTNDCINGFCNEQLRKVKVKCPHCRQWDGILGWNRANLITHRNECGEFPVVCSLQCGQSIPRNKLTAHTSNGCPKRRMRCTLCSAVMPLDVMNQHHFINDSRECRNCHFCARGCGQLVLDTSVAAHRNQCGSVVVTCGVGCGQSIPRSKLAVHERDECPRRVVQCERCLERYYFDTLARHHINQYECDRSHRCPLGCNLLVQDRYLAWHRSDQCTHRPVACPECKVSVTYFDLRVNNATDAVSTDGDAADNSVRCSYCRLQAAVLETTTLLLYKSMTERRILAYVADGTIESMKLIVSHMRQHPHSEPVQRISCQRLVTHLSRPVDKQVFVDAGGIDCIILAMQQHGEACELQRFASYLLYQLAGRVEDRARIAAAGGIECIESAMKRHSAAEGVQQYGTAALSLLSPKADRPAPLDKAGGSKLVASGPRTRSQSRKDTEAKRVKR